jgi:hypothetical protein
MQTVKNKLHIMISRGQINKEWDNCDLLIQLAKRRGGKERPSLNPCKWATYSSPYSHCGKKFE